MEDKILKVITLCSGYDAQCMALEELKKRRPGFDYELVRWGEIDPRAIALHDAVFPQWEGRNVGDISKMDWTELRGEEIDLLTYSTPCFKAGTLVLTSQGFKPIETLCIGEEVLTHNNRYRKVSNVMKRFSSESKYTVGPMCSEDIECTPEHPFYVRRRYFKGHKRERLFAEPQWVKAKDLTTDYYVGIPANVIEKLPSWGGSEDNRWGHHRHVDKIAALFSNSSFWYLMGRYVGDGWTRKGKSTNAVIICCGGRNEEKLTDALSSCGFGVHMAVSRTVRKYFIYSKELVSFVERYGYGAHGKKVDVETMNLPVELLSSFLNGVMDSDGCINDGYSQVTTVSRELAYTLGQCFLKVHNRPFSITKSTRPPKCVIEGREVNQRDTYVFRCAVEPRKRDHSFFEDGWAWMPISSIVSREDAYDVYNISVEEDESYTANGIVVHNCQSLSNAGKREGMKEGSGTASSLIWEVKRAITELRPRWLQMENVKAMVSQMFYPDFVEWGRWVASQGYDNFWAVLNAKDYGVPQSRERVFMVSIRRDEGEPAPHYTFPRPEPLALRVFDLLEEGPVGESYYLGENAVEEILSAIELQSMGLHRSKARRLLQGQPALTNAVGEEDDLSPCLKAHYSKTGTYNIKPRRDGFGEPGVIVPINCQDGGEVAPTITTAYPRAATANLTPRSDGFGMPGLMECPGDEAESMAEKVEQASKTTPAKARRELALTLMADDEPVVQEIGNLKAGPNRNWKSPQDGRVYSPAGVSPTLCTNLVPKVLTPINFDGPTRLRAGDVAQTICTKAPSNGFDKQGQYVLEPGDQLRVPYGETRTFRHGTDGTASSVTSSGYPDNNPVVDAHFRVRKFTEREMYRLMGVPQWAIERMLSCGKVRKSGHYHAAGNSIVVACLERIYENLVFPPEDAPRPAPSLFDVL